MTTLSVTINGRTYGPTEVRDELTMNDYLREYLGLTGTKFGCGAAQCLSCAVIVDNPDGTSYTSPTCIVVPSENSIRLDSQYEPESSHHPGRCLRSCTCSGSSLSTFSSRDAGWKPRTCFFIISLTSH